MFSGSWIEISKSALEQNLGYIRGLLGPQTQLSSVIKGNAYGHGLEQMVPMLQECGVTHFSVFNAEEAFAVHQLLRAKDRLMIMGDVEGDALAWAIEKGVEFFVFDLDRLENALRLSQDCWQKARIHLEVETGMFRTGLKEKDFRKAAEMILASPNLVEMYGICTHFAGAESIANYHRIQAQVRRFKKALETSKRLDLPRGQNHACCSAGILRYPKMNLDLVRVGILQYGHWPSPETMIESRTQNKWQQDPLKRILSWKSRLMSMKEVPVGEFIGYGMSFQARHDMRVAQVPVGYGYGYTRSLSNQGHVLVHGQKAPVIGTVNMNAFTVDISDIPEARPGDTVILIGSDGDESVSVSSFSELSKQLNYEMLTRLPLNIPRQKVK